MKKLIIIVFLYSSVFSFGQNYKPFNTNSKKLFAKNAVAIDSTFSFAFDSVAKQGGDSVYFNYLGLNGYIESDSCQFWGAPTCIEQSKPLWMGSKMVANNQGSYLFFNAYSDTLQINFNILPGDSSLFYSDTEQNFYLVFEGIDTTTVLGFTDSAKFFSIAHTDVFGNTIDSELNNEKVVIGKELGLINFFKIDQFPYFLEPLVLIGNTSPELGMSKISYGMLYDFQVGDEIQYQLNHSVNGGPPWENYERYKKYTYLNRSDTQDSVIYRVARSSFELGIDTLVLDTIFIKHAVNEIFAEIPFDNIDHGWNMLLKNLNQEDYCGLHLWTYKIVPEYLVYCYNENCWGTYDIPGPPPDEETIYVCGLGLYSDRSILNAPPHDGGYYNFNRVIYFKKNGVVCGNEFVVGINESEVLKSNFSVYPNPAGDYLIIESDIANSGIAIICNLNGQKLMKTTLAGLSSKINISSLSPGIYLVKIFDRKSVEVKKVVKK